MSPPELPGYVYKRVLGSGGYSDVFLYEQEMPRRPVAIKVLVAEALDTVGRQQFTDEANSMAAVSTHPFIVTIFHAEVGAGGHPYLVMEFYPRPNYSVRARTEQLSVADVLRTGVQVASAVETAHRAGILHRDIKPANILTSEYGRPGLTDFGIASTAVDGVMGEAAGMSIPWSPPEVISGSAVGDRTADVYSLGATIYTLLAGRSPFEISGGSNRSIDLIDRIERGALPPTGRGDVPASLERLLRQSMSKGPSDRPPSAAAFARALQDIEVEQQFAMTALEVRDEGLDVRARGGEDDEDGTRLKNPVVIHSQSPRSAPGSTTSPRSQPQDSPVKDGTVQRSARSADGLISAVGSAPIAAPMNRPTVVPETPDGTVSPTRAPVEPSTDPTAAPPVEARRSRASAVTAAWVILALVAALVAVRVFMAVGTTDEPDGGGEATSVSVVTTPPRPDAAPPMPENVRLTGNRVTWDAPGGGPYDHYEVLGPDDDVLGTSERGQYHLELEAAPVCVKVVAVRSGSASRPTSCVDE